MIEAYLESGVIQRVSFHGHDLSLPNHLDAHGANGAKAHAIWVD